MAVGDEVSSGSRRANGQMQDADHRKGKSRQAMGADRADRRPQQSCRDAVLFTERYDSALYRGVRGASRNRGVMGVRRYAESRMTRRGIGRDGLGNRCWIDWHEQQ